MRTRRSKRATILLRMPMSLVLAAALALTPAAADATLIGYSGSTSVSIPPVPGNMDLTLVINGEKHEYKSVEDSFSGTLTLTYVASQEEPRTRVQGCAGGASGGGILLEGATPSTTLRATWVPLSGQPSTIGAEVTSGVSDVVASVCSSNADEVGGGDPGGGGDPTDEDPVPPCVNNNSNANGNGQGNGNGNGNGNGGGNGNGNANGNGGGNGNGNAYGHACH